MEQEHVQQLLKSCNTVSIVIGPVVREFMLIGEVNHLEGPMVMYTLHYMDGCGNTDSEALRFLSLRNASTQILTLLSIKNACIDVCNIPIPVET